MFILVSTGSRVVVRFCRFIILQILVGLYSTECVLVVGLLHRFSSRMTKSHNRACDLLHFLIFNIDLLAL